MSEYLEYVRDQLDGIGTITARKMFGGIGLYCDGTFFALIANDVLYLKVDDSNRAAFEELGYEGFQPFPDKPDRMNYFEIPTEILERPVRAREWAQRSVDVARKRSKRSRAKSKAARKPASPAVGRLRNLGPRSAAWLGQVGIKSRADLERFGSIGAFLAVRDSGQRTTLNLLYALEGALLDEPWQDLPGPLKQRLRDAVK